jgi:hypothetical protein
MMSKTKRLLILAVLVEMLSLAASAGTVTDTYYFGPSFISGATTTNAVLHKFNDNLLGLGEQLVDITFSLSVSDIVSASATNSVLSCNASGCTPEGDLHVLTLGAEVPVSVSGPSGMNTGSTPSATQSYPGLGYVLQNIFASCVAFNCVVDNTRILTLTGLTGTSSSSAGVANLPGLFDPYQDNGGSLFNPGDIVITMGPASVIGLGDAHINTSASSNVSGALSVTYTYGSSVPEPISSVLTGTALFVAGLCSRRFRKER